MPEIKRSQIEIGGRPKPNTIDLTLRTQQATFLERVAEIEETSVSQVFGSILADSAGKDTAAGRAPTQRVRKHLVIDPSHQETLNRLAARWGLSKSDVARRLIDEAEGRRGRLLSFATDV